MMAREVCPNCGNLKKEGELDCPKCEVKTMNTTDKIKEIVSEALAVPAKDITLMSDLEDIYGADSLNFIEIVLVAEEEFEIEIPDEEAEKFKTLNDIVKFVEGGGFDGRNEKV